MSAPIAPDIHAVAWATGRNFGEWHANEPLEPWKTLCLRPVPTDARIDRGDRYKWIKVLRIGCRGCRRVYDGMTAAKLTLVKETEARQTYEALRLERDEL